MNNLSEILKKKGKSFSPDLLNCVILESITAKIHEKIFPRTDTPKDQDFSNWLRSLQWITFQNLYINFKWKTPEEIWKLSIEGNFFLKFSLILNFFFFF